MLAVRAYQLGVMLGGGLLPLLLERRAKAGREDPARLDERKARNMAPRPREISFGCMRHPLARRARPCPCWLIFSRPPGHTYSHHNGNTNFGNTGRPVKARKFSRY